MSNSVTVDVTANASAMERVLGSVVGTLNAFKSRVDAIAGRARDALGQLGRGFALVVNEAAEAESAMALVDAGLVASQQSTETWSGQLRAAAGEIQRTTQFSDEFAASLFSLALGMGESADNVVKLSKDAMALSAITGGKIGPEQALVAIKQSSEESWRMLQRYIPALRGAVNEQERQALLAEAVARGYGLVNARAQTFQGTLSRLRNQLSDVAEELGNALLPTLRSLADFAIKIVPQIHAWVSANASLVASIAGWTAGGLALLTVLPQIAAAGSAIATMAGGLIVAIRAVGAAFGAWAAGASTAAVVGGTLAAVLSPIGLAITALAATIGVAVKMHIDAATAAAAQEEAYRSLTNAARELNNAQSASAAARTPNAKLTAAQQEEAALQKMLDAANADVDRLFAERNAHFGKMGRAIDWIAGVDSDAIIAGWNEMLTNAEIFRDSIRERLGGAKSRTQTAQTEADAQRKEDDTTRDARRAAEKRDAKFRDELLPKARIEAELAGKSADEVARLTALHDGLTESQADELAAWVRMKSEIEERAELAKSIDDRLRQSARDTLSARGMSSDAIDLMDLAANGAAASQLTAVADAMERVAEARGADRQRELVLQLKEQAKTEQQITNEKRAQAEQAFKLGLITKEQRDNLIERLRQEQAAKVTANFGEDAVSMWSRVAKASVAANVTLPKMDDAQRRTAEAATELAKIQRETNKAIEEIKTVLVGAVNKIPGFATYSK